MSESTAIATIEAIALPVKFVSEEVTDAIENIRRAALAEADGLDISRPGDRDRIKSIAHRVSKSKAAMERLGKSLSDRRRAEIADEVNAIMVERKRIESELDTLRDSIRQPVTEWEQKEEARIAGHEAAITAIQVMVQVPSAGQWPTSQEVIDRLAELDAVTPRNWEEFQSRAEQAMAFTREDLDYRLKQLLTDEHEAAELARLRAEEAERQRKAHDTRIAAVAAENAKREAKEEARAEATAEAFRVESARVAREDAARKEREAAAARELALEQQRKQAELDRIAAENAVRAAEERRIADAAAAERLRKDQEEAATLAAQRAAEKAVRDQAAAIERERQRVAKIVAEQDAARVKREADTKHRAKINAAARDAIMSVIAGVYSGSTPAVEIATEIVKAIAKGEIPNIKIEY